MSECKLTQEQEIRSVAVREANYFFGFTHKALAGDDPIRLSVVLDHAQYIEQYIADGTLPTRIE